MDRARRRCAALCLLTFFSLAAAECGGTSTISSANVPSSIRACATWDGTLVVGHFQATAGFDRSRAPTPSVALPSLSTVNGDLVFTSIAAPSNFNPTTIGPPQTTPTQRKRQSGDQAASNGDAVSFGISLPELSVVNGNLIFKDLDAVRIIPELSALSSVARIEFSNVNFGGDWAFTRKKLKVLQHVNEMTFAQTNAVSIGTFDNLQVINLGSDEARIIATDNALLSNIGLGGFASTNAYVEIRNNGELSVNFPDLNIATLDMGGVSDFTAPMLGTLGLEGQSRQSITGNTFQTLNFSSVTTILGQLSITDNKQLSQLDFSSLSQTGDLEIDDNPRLSKVNILSTATGTVNVVGPSQVCSSLNLPDATYSCSAAAASTTSGSSAVPTSGGSTDSGSSGLSTGAKAGIGVGVGLGALIIAGVLLFFCCRRRRDKPYSSRELSAEPYSKSQHSYTESGEMAYSKVPTHSATGAGMSEPHSEEHTPTSALADNWTPPEREVPSARDRVELEEQQGMRHEMDARSLPDMDSEDDEEADTRSLEDIERIHRER